MGKINKDLSLLKEWGVYKALHFKNSNYVIRMADLNTPFQKLVSSAQEATIQHRRISKKEIKKALADEGKLCFTFLLRGESLTFAKDYHAVLFYQGKYIQPIVKYNWKW